MKKSKLIIIVSIIVGALVIVSLYGTFATSSTVSGSDNTYTITLTGSTEEVVVPANSSKTIIYQITNTNKGIVQYGVVYSGTNISVKHFVDSQDDPVGTIDYGENKFIKLYVENSGDDESTATIKTILGYENGGSLDDLIPSGYGLANDYYCLGNLEKCISSMYNKSEKNVYTIYNKEYNYATSVNLMNDRLGGATEDYDAGNIRYYGINPNNYIDIGDVYSEDVYDDTVYTELNYTSYEECVSSLSDTECGLLHKKGDTVLYRIIGVFKDIELEDGTTDNLVKIVRNESIGEYPFDDGSSDWATSTLQSVLNENEYYTSLSENVLDKIENVVWHYNSANNSSPNQSYINERGSTTWPGQVTIIYISDYGYARDFNCSQSNFCPGSNWLYNGKASYFFGKYTNNNVYAINASGVINGANWVATKKHTYPTFFLKSNKAIMSGIGTEKNPYVLN